MKSLLSLSVFVLLGTTTASAQELLYSAKYQVFKVVLREGSNKGTYRDLRTWHVNMIMITGRSRSTGKPRILMGNATGDKYFLRHVGAPTYRITDVGEHPIISHAVDGVYEEYYAFATYKGLIAPSKPVIGGTSLLTALLWRSTVEGAKSLSIFWDKEEQQGRYKLTFYCQPVE